ncbi:MAG: hypothetical protein JO112_15160 [Planctomycetes bacterium]|nr:hypothetical protein [Planctomycetota bacterium]
MAAAGVFAFYCLLLVFLPLAIQLSRPIAFHDYFGHHLGGISSHPDQQLWKSRSLLNNLVFDYLQNEWNYRPVTNFFYNLGYYYFHGNFWVFDLGKWALKFLAALLIFSSLRHLGCDRLPALAGAAFFLFHLTSFEAMTFAADPVLAFFFLVCVYLLTLAPTKEADPGLDLARFGPLRFLALLGALFLMLGSKEPSTALTGVLLLAFLVFSTYTRRTFIKWLSLALVLLVNCWEILRPAMGRIKPVPVSQPFLTRLGNIVPYTVGFRVNSIYFVLLALLVAYGLYRSWGGKAFRFQVFFLVSLIAVTVFNCLCLGYPNVAWPRYAIPGAAVLALLVGLSLAQVRACPRIASLLFLAVYPLLTGENILATHVTLHKYHKDGAYIINFIINKQREGSEAFLLPPKSLAGWNAIYPEDFLTLRHFFNLYGPRFYQLDLHPVKMFPGSEAAPETFTLFTPLEYGNLDENLRNHYQITLYRFRPSGYGLVDNMIKGFHRASRLLHNKDLAAFDIPSTNRLRVYYLRKSPQPGYREFEQVNVDFGALAP